MAHGSTKPRRSGHELAITKGPKPSTPRGWRRFNALNEDKQKQRSSRWYK